MAKQNGKNRIYTVKLSSSSSGESTELFLWQGNSIQKWMWVEKGVPGVSTCTVWQSEYPWFLICPFLMWSRSQHQRCVRYGKSAAIHSINPTLQLVRYVRPQVLQHPPNTHGMALSGTVSWTTNPQHLSYDYSKWLVVVVVVYVQLWH